MAKHPKDASARRSNVRHGRQHRSNAWMNGLRVVATTALVLVLSGVSVAAYAVWDLANKVQTVDLGTKVPDAAQVGSEAVEGELNILLVGSDSRAGQSLDDGEEGELNDVTMLLHVSADHQNATVISFPRDLMVPVPSCTGPEGEEDYYPAASERQFNTTLGQGGLSCVVETVSELTGLVIPYGGVVTFDGVINISNAVGGVDVCLTAPIDDPYTGLVLPAGENTLVGVEALQFLRTRHGVGDGGDTSRISNQQIFMSSMVRKLKSAETLSDPMKVYGLAKAAVENMTLSSGFTSISMMQQVASTLKNIDLNNINFVQFPNYTHPYQAGRLAPDMASAQTMMDLLRAGQPITVSATGEAVEVVGGEVAPVDPNAVAPVEGAPVEPVAPPAGALPENITGQSAATVTCSQGRTQF
ncbi:MULTISPECIES: LCP family protein [unclassified Leucobacter]|uniref:LCP family protein n=1 Tax=unclassified Leucobacter TaxID=2621730 RepID=UPI00165E3828|nr:MULTISPECIES: LCP family protein [unclassified Leucobacter]MBC9927156.1 LCP family protein [Leucobacter sp. cx-169]